MEALKKRFRSTYTSEQLPSYTQPYDAVAIRPKDKPAPWIDDPEPWSPLRIGIAQILNKKRFDMLTGAITIANVVVMIYQADYEAQCFPTYVKNPDLCPFTKDAVLSGINLGFLIWYSLEVSARIFVERRNYFKVTMNRIDFLVTIMGWTADLSGAAVNINFLRIIRVLRLARAFRMALQFRELYLMVDSVMASVKAIAIGTLLLFALMLIYSIVLVEVVHPKSSVIDEKECGDCKDGFSSVGHSVITLFKTLIAGDSWIVGMPLIKPTPWLAPLLIFIVVSITLGIVNLILTVIVERAADARQKDLHALAKAKAAAREGLNKKLLELCKKIDNNGDNQLTRDEMTEAFDQCQDFQDLMTNIDIQKSELELIMKVADKDCSGFLDYREFCEELSRYKSFDNAMMIVMARISLQEMGMDIERLEGKILQHLDQTSLKVNSQEKMLISINQKLDMLVAKPVDDLHSGVAETQKHVPAQHIQLQRQEDNADTTSAKVLLDEIQREVTSIANEGGVMIQKLQEQLSTMSRHAEAVALLHEGAPENLHFDDGFARSGKEPRALLRQLRQNMCLQRTILMCEAQQEISVAGGLIDINTTLLKRLNRSSPCGSDDEQENSAALRTAALAEKIALLI